MMLMAAYAASTGGIGTPVGTPPNLIGIAMIENYCKVKIFFQWMLICIPILILLFALLFFLLYFLHKPELANIEGSQE
jgi:sodium-dependent dicarboxylate transporter 2/3/5